MDQNSVFHGFNILMVVSGFEQFQEVTRRKWSKRGDSNIKKKTTFKLRRWIRKIRNNSFVRIAFKLIWNHQFNNCTQISYLICNNNSAYYLFRKERFHEIVSILAVKGSKKQWTFYRRFKIPRFSDYRKMHVISPPSLHKAGARDSFLLGLYLCSSNPVESTGSLCMSTINNIFFDCSRYSLVCNFCCNSNKFGSKGDGSDKKASTGFQCHNCFRTWRKSYIHSKLHWNPLEHRCNPLWGWRFWQKSFHWIPVP